MHLTECKLMLIEIVASAVVRLVSASTHFLQKHPISVRSEVPLLEVALIFRKERMYSMLRA